MAGEVVDVQVVYTVDTEGGPKRITVDLAAMIRHCRPERVGDLIEDLALLCDDVLARRHPEDSGAPILSVIRGRR